MGTTLKTIIEHWRYIAPIVKRPENEKDYESLVSHLDTLLDMVGDNDRHPLVGLVDIISDHISAYEAEHHPPPVAMTGVAALRFLMDEHGLTQSDFENEIGSQGVVSEILNGRCKLNLKHIKNWRNASSSAPKHLSRTFAKPLNLSYPRKRVSTLFTAYWIPADAGMTESESPVID